MDIKDLEGARHKIAALQRHINRMHRKVEKADRKLLELADRIGKPPSADTEAALSSARVENAFLREAISRGADVDVETMWDLAQARGFLDVVKVTDGKVEGIDDAYDRVLERYPWLTEEPASDADADIPSKRTAPGPRKRKDGNAPDPSSLVARMPHLAKHVGR